MVLQTCIDIIIYLVSTSFGERKLQTTRVSITHHLPRLPVKAPEQAWLYQWRLSKPALSFWTMSPCMVLSHIEALNCKNMLYFCSPSHPKGAREVLVECVDSPLLHRSLLIKDIFKIATCSFVLLATAVKLFSGAYTAQSEDLGNITLWPPSKHVQLKLWINVKGCQRRATLCRWKSDKISLLVLYCEA